MKSIIRLSIFLLLLIVLLFNNSCQKEYSCENCKGNKPPIANAGPDQVITLPTDSVSLDGSLSSDPNGSISGYLWTKISGPASFTITNASATRTVVKNVAAGAYRFELKVTDNGGLFAKDTMNVIVNDLSQPNHPPVANAGTDQTITLPTNTNTLDGSASTDPDNNIVSYAWTKISGPSSFNISNANAVQTQVSNLVQGIYKFELKVTDNGGLSGKDTIQITINPSNPVGISCNITMDAVAHLPTAGPVGCAFSAGSKILFTRITSNSVVDIYDTLTHNWESVNGMNATGYYSASSKATVVSNKIIFYAAEGTPAINQLINLYDASSDSWSVSNLPGRGRSFYTTTVVGSKAIFASGEGIDSNISKTIDIYDASNNSWSLSNFNEGRRGMAAESAGNKVLFAGGYNTRYDTLVQVCDDYGNNCYSEHPIAPINRVDIWDMVSNTWSVAQLSEARCFMVTAVVGNKIIFAGGDKLDGNHSNQVDVYDAANNTWSSHTVSSSSWYGPVLAYTVGNKVLICNWISDRIDIYDASLNSWSIVHMSAPLIGEQHQVGQVATAGNKIVFFVQYNMDEINSKNIDVYDATTNTWCHTQLNQPMVRQGIVTCGNKVYVGGGFTMIGCCIYNNPIDTVWHLDF